MTKLRRTQTRPPVYFLHSEVDVPRRGIEGSCGIAAGYLSTRELEPLAKERWTEAFVRHWKDSCFSLARGLYHLGIEAFVLVPCSRREVVEPMRSAFREEGLEELPPLIRKRSPEVSFAGRDGSYIAAKTALACRSDLLKGVGSFALCDDFAETGSTLLGLHAFLKSQLTRRQDQIVLAAVGVSRRLAEPPIWEATHSKRLGCSAR